MAIPQEEETSHVIPGNTPVVDEILLVFLESSTGLLGEQGGIHRKRKKKY